MANVGEPTYPGNIGPSLEQTAEGGILLRQITRSAVGKPPIVGLAVLDVMPPGTGPHRALHGIAEALRQRGKAVRYIHSPKEASAKEALLAWGVKDHIFGTPAAYILSLCPVDTFEISGQHVWRMNNLDMCFGLSRWSCQKLKELGVDEPLPLALAANPVDPHIRPGVINLLPQATILTPHNLEEVFRPSRFWFLVVSAMQPRKNIEAIIDAYAAAFGPKDRVGLFIKASTAWKCYRQDEIASWLQSKNTAPIVYTEQDITDEELSALYKWSNAYVTASYIEGWGLGAIEALAHGRPVIASAGSGHLDFLFNGNAFMVPTVSKPFVQVCAVPPLDGKAAEVIEASVVDVHQLAQTMQKVATQKKLSGHLARNMHATAKELCWDNTAKAVVDRLSEKGIMLARADEFVLGPRRAQRFRVILSGEAGCSVHTVLTQIADALERWGYEVVRSEGWSSTQADEVVVVWGQRPALPIEPVAVLLIDPIDGWAFDARSVHHRNTTATVTYGLASQPTQRLKDYGIQNAETLPLGIDTSKWFVERDDRWFAKFISSHCQYFGGDKDLPDRWITSVAVAQPRKGLMDLVEAFIAEFNADEGIGLILKTKLAGWGQTILPALQRVLKDQPNHPPILLCEEDLSDTELRKIYSHSDVYASVSRWEGWGLTVLEAGLCSAVVAATDYAGHKDFLTPENAVLIPCKEEIMGLDGKAPEVPDHMLRSFVWGKPECKDIQKALRQAINTAGDFTGKLAMTAAMHETARRFPLTITASKVLTTLFDHSIGVERARHVKSVVRNRPSIAILTPTHQYAAHLARLIPSLDKTDGVNLELFIQDDGWDESPQLVTTLQRDVSFPIHFQRTQRIGVSAARQRLLDLAFATKDFNGVCWVDGDIEISYPEWLIELIALHEMSGSGLTGPKIYLPDGSIWAAGGGWSRSSEGKIGHAILAHMHKLDGPLANMPRIVPHLPLACAYMDSAEARKLKFPSWLGLRGLDDTEVSMQVRFRMGKECWYRPEAFVVHHAFSARKHTPAEAQLVSDEMAPSTTAFWKAWGCEINDRERYW